MAQFTVTHRDGSLQQVQVQVQVQAHSVSQVGSRLLFLVREEVDCR